jgi:high-affinity nickel-transport protein
VFVALFVGVIELAQVLIQVFHLQGRVFAAIASLDILGKAGYVIVAAFIVAWASALVIYKVRRIDERWAATIEKVA